MKTRTKTILATIAAATALTGFAGAASAQPYGYERGYDRGYGSYEHRHDWGRGADIDRMEQQLDQRIDRGIRRGQLTRDEARSMQLQLRDILRLEARYERDGLSGYERNELQRRLVAFEQRLDYQLHDGQYYASRR